MLSKRRKRRGEGDGEGCIVALVFGVALVVLFCQLLELITQVERIADALERPAAQQEARDGS